MEIIPRIIPCVEEMIQRLPEKYRSALIMTTYQGLTQKEMGRELGLSCSGAKSRIQRAREHLRTELTHCCDFKLDPWGRVIDFEPRH